MKQVRFGIIGIGNMGRRHAQWIEEGKIAGGVLSAVCDILPECEKWARENLSKDVIFYKNHIDLLDSGTVDAVIISTTHYQHPAIAADALNRNIHILVEKPVGVFTKNVRELNELIDRKPNLVFGMMFNQRMNSLYQKVKEIVDRGDIGELRRTNWIITSWYRPQAYYNMSSWRASWEGEGGGVLTNQAPHQLDLWQWICGMPVKVSAHLQYGSHRNIIVEDDVTAFVEYENGATGTFITCTHDFLGTDRFEIYGNKGKIIIENSSKVTVKILKEPEEELNKRLTFEDIQKMVLNKCMEDLCDTDTFEIPDQWGIQHIKVTNNFTDAILYGKPLITPGKEGIRALTLANAMYLSSWTGKEVEIPFDEELFYAELQKRIKEEKKQKNIFGRS